MTKSVKGLWAGALLLIAMQVAFGAEEKFYTDGPVVNVAYIKTKPGQFDAYMKYLATTYKQLMEEQKKAGFVLNWSVFRAQPRAANDPDLILTITFKNWAALDGLSERVDAAQKKVWSTAAGVSKAQVDRESLREAIGSQTVQQLIIK